MIKKKVNVVFDIGKTNVKLVLFDNKRNLIKEVKTKQTIKKYKNKISYLNSEKLIKWLFQKFNELSDSFKFNKFVCTTHGSTVAFISNNDKEIIASTDYEYNYDEFNKDFIKISPSFNSSLTPHLEVGLNIGQQIYYLKHTFPEIISNTKYILFYPQYVSWKLSGKYSSEISYIGCHTFLWNFKKNKFSNLVKKLNISEKFPKINKAWEIIGHFFVKSNKIKVLNGIHDSNASYLYFKNSKLKNFTLVSTGTWYVIFNEKTKLSTLNPNLDMLCNIDIFGNHVPTMRFMGGREYDELCRLLNIKKEIFSEISEIEIIKNLIYPSFASAGPFKLNKKLKKIKNIILNNNQKYSLICIYMAFNLNFCLDYMNSTTDIILDGPITKNPNIMGILACLRTNQKVYKNEKEIGTSLGASVLFNLEQKSKIDLIKISYSNKINYEKIYKIWFENLNKKKLIHS